MKFTTEEREKILNACEEWKGTPHVHRRAIPGKGVDCLHFVAAVLVAGGIIEPRSLPSYPTAWGFMSPENILGAGLTRTLHAERIPWDRVKNMRFGDIVIFKAGRQSNHVGIFVGEKLWHVMTNGTVQPEILARYSTGIQEVVRLNKKGWKVDPASVKVQRLLE